MLNSKPIEKILFLDIETTSQFANFDDIDQKGKELFIKRFLKEEEKNKLLNFSSEEEKKNFLENIYSDKAPIFAEWGKIICISVGSLVKGDNNKYKMKKHCFVSEDEKELLQKFVTRLDGILNSKSIATEKTFSFDDSAFALCAHNGKVFDFPFIAKRLIINGIDLPKMFDFSLAKPWDLHYFIDTKDVWKFGVFDGSVSLDILAYTFGIKSSKQDEKGHIEGSQVKNIFYKDKDLKRIAKYCDEDILALARIYLKMKNVKEEIEEFES